MLKVGMIGMGGISRAHRGGWAKIDEAEVVAVCDNTHENTPLYFALALEILVGVCYTCSRLIYLYS